MTNSNSTPPIGILGLGFLGQTLAREFADVPECWGTWHKTPPPDSPLKIFPFDWSSENSWTALPETPETLVLTIPPLLKNPEAEEERLRLWGEWMNRNRPNLKRMIYISSTGVYPKHNGLWHEDSEFEPDTNSGKLRLVAEETLSQYFQLQVVRPGGIYGCGRGIDVRLKSGKAVRVSGTPVHRIHVKDLARIICHLVKHPESTRCVNAVDFEPKPSWEVAHWLVKNRDDLSEEMLNNNPDSSATRSDNSTSLPDSSTAFTDSKHRFISNQRMLDLGITLSYPTFREGMASLSLNS